MIRVVPLSYAALTVRARLPGFYDLPRFGVEQKREGFLLLTFQSVSLPLAKSQPRLSYGIFWKEPAIAWLDWYFAPNPRSLKGLGPTIRSDLHPGFAGASSCPGLDRQTSGLTLVTTGC